MSSLAGELIPQYFEQLIRGCDCIECREPECRSHKTFNDNFHFQNNNEAAYHAIKQTLRHPFDSHLCPGISRIRLDPSLQIDVDKFDNTIKSLIRTNESQPFISSSAHHTLQLFSNQYVFPYILLSNQNSLSKDNMAINDETIGDLIKLMQHNPKMFSEENFQDLVNNVLKENSNTFHHIRSLILLLIFDPFYSPKTFENTLIRILKNVISLNADSQTKVAQNIFFSHLVNLPRVLRQVLDICQNSLTMYIYDKKDRNLGLNPYNEQFLIISRFLMLLREAMFKVSIKPLPSKQFSNEIFSGLVEPAFFVQYFFGRLDPRLKNAISTFVSNTAIFTLDFKYKVFVDVQAAKQDVETRAAVLDMVSQNGFLLPQEQLIRGSHLNLEVRRDHIIEDTIDAVQLFRDQHLNRKLMVSFRGEDGVDAGGVSREYFHLLMEQLFSPDYGMFTLVQNSYYWFNQNDLGIMPIYYRTLGTVVALAVYNGIILPIRFPILMYKKILKKEITFNDLYEFDPEIAKSLKKIIDMKEKGEDVSALALNFTVTVDNFGEIKEIPLIPNGENEDVTNENVLEYIHLYVKWITNDSIDTKFKAFATGFWKLFNGKVFEMFAPDELDILVSGEPVRDWDSLRKNVKYSDGYRPNSRQVKWFWEIFDRFSDDMKCKFLQFTTGSDRAPVGGLASVVLTIQKTNDPTKLPVSHTCFSIFGLPCYSSKAEMEKKIRIALTQTEGFGLK
ncbi:ubiquitin ligase [Tritrichomonas foetus]|uniref:HECT-type E3 ubiquitin transferase n=1 Tax=Tritrichomonas foetus TaxID=1144522 RepID=A0A1J4KD99_9EUKA|nr:ubiquitin ligase [Tritrichomonas foetus]|eukprot:OHT09171.1 ubiquitin ligase [Tritrichomonas foetus]